MSKDIAKDIDFWAHCQTLPVSSIYWEGNKTVVMADEFMKLVDYAKELKKERDALTSSLASAKDVIYCVDGYCSDFNKSDFGSAKEWLRHIVSKYQDFTANNYDLTVLNSEKSLAKRDFEQQAKGVQSVIDDKVAADDGYISVQYLKDCVEDFKEQAKQLRE